MGVSLGSPGQPRAHFALCLQDLALVDPYLPGGLLWQYGASQSRRSKTPSTVAVTKSFKVTGPGPGGDGGTRDVGARGPGPTVSSQPCDLTTAEWPPCPASAGEMQPGLRNAALARTPVGAGGWLFCQRLQRNLARLSRQLGGTTGYWPGRVQVVTGATIVERRLLWASPLPHVIILTVVCIPTLTPSWVTPALPPTQVHLIHRQAHAQLQQYPRGLPPYSWVGRESRACSGWFVLGVRRGNGAEAES